MRSYFNSNICFADPGWTNQNYQRMFHWNWSLGRLFFVPIQIFNILEIRQGFFIVSIEEEIINFRFILIFIIGNYNVIIEFSCSSTENNLFWRYPFRICTGWIFPPIDLFRLPCICLLYTSDAADAEDSV